MMSLASVLASLGLMEGSTAVVIGAMLVAPLMGPLLAAGLAVTQGDFNLFKTASGATLVGMLIGFSIALVLGLLNQSEPSLEVEARNNPTIFDLAIAFASGMAAAYARARPNVAATLAGVAIAAALVPPLAVVGLALTSGRPFLAANAAVLLVTNVIAITLGAALVFRMLRVRGTAHIPAAYAWARRAVIVLTMSASLLAAPLLVNLLDEAQLGQSRPLFYPVAPVVRQAIRQYVDEAPGVELITVARTSVEPELGITIVLETDHELDEEFEDGLESVVREARGSDDPVRIHPLRAARVASTQRGNEPTGPDT